MARRRKTTRHRTGYNQLEHRGGVYPGGVATGGVPPGGWPPIHDLVGYFYHFDGSTMYATMADWTPLGLPFQVKVSFIPEANDATRRVLSGPEDGGKTIRLTTTNIQYFYDRVEGLSIFNANPYLPDAIQVAKATVLANEATFGSNGGNSTKTGASLIAGVTDTIGARTGGTELFQGPIGKLYLTDGSPFQQAGGRDILEGNGNRTITIPEFLIGANDDFTISIDYIRQDRSGTSFTNMLGSAATNVGIQFADTLHATLADTVRIYGDAGSQGLLNTTRNVALGQHANVTVSRAGSVIVGFVDDVLTSNGNSVIGAISIDTLYSYNNTNKVPVGASLGSVILHNKTTGDYVHYKLDEGTGTDIKAYDDKGFEIPAKNGTVTPDAAWGNVPDNSRYYPMDEGAGNTFLCYTDDTKVTPDPTNDVTITGYVDDTPWQKVE